MSWYESSLAKPKLAGMDGCLSKPMAALKPLSVVVLAKKCTKMVVLSGVWMRCGSDTISILGDEGAVKYDMSEKGEILKCAMKTCSGPAKVHNAWSQYRFSSQQVPQQSLFLSAK